jgi:hypothetical protein
VEFQNAIKAYHLENEYKKYHDTLASISTVFDFYFPNSITLPKENFYDSLHYDSNNKTITETLIHDIFTSDAKPEAKKVAKVYGPQ